MEDKRTEGDPRGYDDRKKFEGRTRHVILDAEASVGVADPRGVGSGPRRCRYADPGTRREVSDRLENVDRRRVRGSKLQARLSKIGSGRLQEIMRRSFIQGSSRSVSRWSSSRSACCRLVVESRLRAKRRKRDGMVGARLVPDYWKTREETDRPWQGNLLRSESRIGFLLVGQAAGPDARAGVRP